VQTSGNVGGDPLLSIWEIDFHLRAASPAGMRCSGAANNPFVVGNSRASDKDGVVRRKGRRFDLARMKRRG